jgi:NADP-dependent 3-hydroxy acid dehydrogenase YdfG
VGLGSAIGPTLTPDGFQVILAGRDLGAAQRVADDIGESLGSRPHPGQVDVKGAMLMAQAGVPFGVPRVRAAS